MKRKLFICLSYVFAFFLTTFIIKSFLLSFAKDIITNLERSIIATNNGLLIITVVKGIIHETLVDLPVFLLSYSFIYFYFKNSKLSIKIFNLIVITLSLYTLNRIIYQDKWELVIFVFILIFEIVLLIIFHNNKENFAANIFVLLQVNFGFNCLLLAPFLNNWGIGQRDLISGIKIGANYLIRDAILNFVSLSFFLPFTLGAIFLSILSVMYTLRLETEKREKEKEKELRIMKNFAEEAQVWQELHFLLHDLKSPLMTISGLNSLNEMQLESPQLKAYCQRINQSVETVNEMISEFLHNEKRKDISVNELIKFVRANVIVKNANPKVVFKINDNLPQININRIRMARALINIIENAIHAVSFQEDPLILIKVNSDPNGNVVFTIKDNGIGIPDENLEKIWNIRFTTKTGSGGLGLSFVKNVIESHSGSIKIYSKKGDGTQVEITLPGVKASGSDFNNRRQS
jgi:signal transduction histidine kinase